jgi:hypothetical protein
VPLPARSLSARVLFRLISAEAQESDPRLRDDLRIARLTVAYAAHGDAVLCSPHVLASYMVLGLHPEKVWPAIQARRKALGPCDDVLRVPKKPAQSVKLWGDETNGARAANSRAGYEMVRQGPRLPSMATASIAALYRSSDGPSSAKAPARTLGELKQIVYYSGAEHSVRALTFSALEARGPWPKEDGPATPVISVSVTGMMIDGNCCRRTVYYRIQRALSLGYWRHTRRANSWTDCPKCREKRRVGTCAKCGYEGKVRDEDGKYTGEFTRSNVYEFDLQKFIVAKRCKEIRHPDWRSYAEYKNAAKRGEHPHLSEMPRKPAEDAPAPPPKSPAPARREEPRRKTAAHHALVHTEISDRLNRAAELIFDCCGLADRTLLPDIASGVLGESKFQGIEIEDAGKYIEGRSVELQRRDVSLNRSYWKEVKWRTSHGGQQQTSAQGRADRSQQSLVSAWNKFKAAESERAGTGQADSLDPNQLKE